MSRFQKTLAAAAVAILSVLWPGEARATDPAATRAESLYIVVMEPTRAGEKPFDVTEHGGTLKYQVGSRAAVLLPETAVDGVRRNPRVRYIQQLGIGLLEPAPGATASSVHRTETGATPGTRSAPQVETLAGSASLTLGPYRYDGAGNIYEIGTTVSGSTSTDTYGYDRVGRLAAASLHDGTAARTESYSYDAAGNLVQITKPGSVVALPVDPATNQLLSSHGFWYDDVGQLYRSPVVSSYEYDQMGMISSINDRAFYIYTAADERIATIREANTTGETWKWTLRDQSAKPVREFESFGQRGTEYFLWTGDRFFAGGTAVAAQREQAEGGRRHFHVDHLGTPRLVTNGSGQRVSTHVYLPFGVEATSNSQERDRGFTEDEAVRFTGHERDGLDGFGGADWVYPDYMHARYYDSNWGRFLSVDPTWESADLGKPQSWNRYSYVRNNPVNMTDPDGRIPAVAIWFGRQIAWAAARHVGREVTRTSRDAVAEASGGYLLLRTGALGPVVAPTQLSVRDEYAIDDSRITRLPDDRISEAPDVRGNAPVGDDGHPIEIHHDGQQPDSPLVEMTRTEHRGKGNFGPNHSNTGQKPSQIDRKEWLKAVRDYWKREWDRGRFRDDATTPQP